MTDLEQEIAKLLDPEPKHQWSFNGRNGKHCVWTCCHCNKKVRQDECPPKPGCKKAERQAYTIPTDPGTPEYREAHGLALEILRETINNGLGYETWNAMLDVFPVNTQREALKQLVTKATPEQLFRIVVEARKDKK